MSKGLPIVKWVLDPCPELLAAAVVARAIRHLSAAPWFGPTDFSARLIDAFAAGVVDLELDAQPEVLEYCQLARRHAEDLALTRDHLVARLGAYCRNLLDFAGRGRR
jgi:hypothetical protein